MAEFSVNPHRFDPYKSFKFRLLWDGRVVAGVSKVSALRRSTEVVRHRDGADPNVVRKSPGAVEFEPISIERGITHDKEFEAWANLVWNARAGAGAEVALKSFRKDIILQLMNEAGQVALSYAIFRCWPSEFQVLPELDANGNAVAIEKLVLQHEGFERDEAAPEPTEQG